MLRSATISKRNVISSAAKTTNSDARPRSVSGALSRPSGRFGLNAIHDIQVLCPMNRGGVGARSLNIELQAALNPAGDRKVERFGWTFAPGDKDMQIENDYDKEVYNGDDKGNNREKYVGGPGVAEPVRWR